MDIPQSPKSSQGRRRSPRSSVCAPGCRCSRSRSAFATVYSATAGLGLDSVVWAAVSRAGWLLAEAVVPAFVPCLLLLTALSAGGLVFYSQKRVGFCKRCCLLWACRGRSREVAYERAQLFRRREVGLILGLHVESGGVTTAERFTSAPLFTCR